MIEVELPQASQDEILDIGTDVPAYVIEDSRDGSDPDAGDNSGGEGGADGLTPRQQQRRDQRSRRNPTRQKVASLEQTVSQLQQKLHEIERGGFATQAAMLDIEIAKYESLHSGWQAEYIRAEGNRDPRAAAEAQEYQRQAAQAAAELARQRQDLARQVSQTPRPSDVAIQQTVQEFARRNPTFDPRNDPASNKIARIGGTLEKMGLSPASREYFDELEFRCRAQGLSFVSPFDDDEDDDVPQRPAQRQAPARRGNGMAPTGGRGDGSAMGGGAAAGRSNSRFVFTPEIMSLLKSINVDTSDRAEMEKWAKRYQAQAKGGK